MNYNRIIYQIYPLGFCGAPKTNDGIPAHRIRKVIDWIKHFKTLNVTSVMFNPVFESDAHGYDTRDFDRIDTRLGTEEDFKVVCNALQKEGLEVILDGVFNHVGRGCPLFQDVIHNRENSPYKDWFHINFYDSNGPDGFWYEGWEGHNELVKLNLDNPEVRNYLIEKALSWIEKYHINGLRLDVAYMLNRQFLYELTGRIRSLYPDFLFIGEMINGDYNVLMNDNLLDSVTNYECRKGIYSSFNCHNLCEIGYSLNRQFADEQWTLYKGKHLLSFVDNHDVNRIASELNEKEMLPLVYSLLCAMPGIPCIYYGSEWGAEGKKTNCSDDDLRPCFDSPDTNMLTIFISHLNKIRLGHPVFTYGNYRQIQSQNEYLVFERNTDTEKLIYALNLKNEPVTVWSDFGNEEMEDVLTNTVYSLNNGLSIPPKSALFLIKEM